MPADEPTVELRPRAAFEAIDLGFAMARAWWRPLVTTWLSLVVPFAALIAIALRDSPWVAVLVLWWLRPLFARVPLHVLSRKTFGQPTGVVDTLRAFPQLARTGLFSSLTVRRLSPARTMLQPVLQLEGLRGPALRARNALLASRDLGAAMVLMSVSANLTGAIAFGAYAGVAMLVPEDVSWDFGALFSPFFQDIDMGWLGLLLPGLYLFAMSLLEPLLVASGFAMYLNRRVFLEGWDIEIALRRLTERVALAATPRIAALVAIACLGCSFAWPDVARAETADLAACDPSNAQTAEACVQGVLASGEFGGTREVEWWALKEFEFLEDEDPDRDPDGFLSWLGPALVRFFELVLWILLAVALFVIASAFARQYGDARRNVALPQASPTRLFGLDLEPDSLPRDLVGAARAARQRGDFIEALSLLYRGALIHLIEAHGVRIPESATEYECVELVRTTEHDRRLETSRAFQDLTQAWLGARYAAAPPIDARFDALCDEFSSFFVVRAETTNTGDPA